VEFLSPNPVHPPRRREKQTPDDDRHKHSPIKAKTLKSENTFRPYIKPVFGGRYNRLQALINNSVSNPCKVLYVHKLQVNCVD
jgi:hypothetical protein